MQLAALEYFQLHKIKIFKPQIKHQNINRVTHVEFVTRQGKVLDPLPLMHTDKHVYAVSPVNQLHPEREQFTTFERTRGHELFLGGQIADRFFYDGFIDVKNNFIGEGEQNIIFVYHNDWMEVGPRISLQTNRDIRAVDVLTRDVKRKLHDMFKDLVFVKSHLFFDDSEVVALTEDDIDIYFSDPASPRRKLQNFDFPFVFRDAPVRAIRETDDADGLVLKHIHPIPLDFDLADHFPQPENDTNPNADETPDPNPDPNPDPKPNQASDLDFQDKLLFGVDIDKSQGDVNLNDLAWGFATP